MSARDRLRLASSCASEQVCRWEGKKQFLHNRLYTTDASGLDMTPHMVEMVPYTADNAPYIYKN